MDIKNNILETIGNTPLIKLNKITASLPCTVLAKVDYFNPGNSIKDRMAVKMIEVAEAFWIEQTQPREVTGFAELFRSGREEQNTWSAAGKTAHHKASPGGG